MEIVAFFSNHIWNEKWSAQGSYEKPQLIFSRMTRYELRNIIYPHSSTREVKMEKNDTENSIFVLSCSHKTNKPDRKDRKKSRYEYTYL